MTKMPVEYLRNVEKGNIPMAKRTKVSETVAEVYGPKEPATMPKDALDDIPDLENEPLGQETPFPDEPIADEEGSVDLDGTEEKTTPVLSGLSSLSEYQLDRKKLAEDRKALYLPKGAYRWKKRLDAEDNVSVGFLPDDSEPGDLSSQGRMLITVHGEVESSDGLHRGYNRVTLSPDRRAWYDSEGTELAPVDPNYELFHSADKLFFQNEEREAGSITELIAWLLSNVDKYTMYIGVSKNEKNFTRQFQAPKQPRKRR